MLYLFYGDREKAREEWRKVLAAFKKKHPTGDIFRFEAENFNQAQFEELITGRGLFGEKILVVGDELGELVVDYIPQMAASPNTFILAEAKPPPETLKTLAKAGAKVLECQNVKSPALIKNQFNIFSLTNALGERDRKKMWLLYQEALNEGWPAEEIFWKLQWQVKTLLLVKASPAAPIPNLKPFVLQKNRAHAKNFSLPELRQLSASLLALWHESKRETNRDFATGLERLVLSI
ncbi:MAG: hypothetical protein HYT48_00180 [Candidatus Vogelbacteria bacterium]|nr:hypothetical protein [Candidatus Vogelbacteria bacterium]